MFGQRKVLGKKNPIISIKKKIIKSVDSVSMRSRLILMT